MLLHDYVGLLLHRYSSNKKDQAISVLRCDNAQTSAKLMQRAVIGMILDILNECEAVNRIITQ